MGASDPAHKIKAIDISLICSFLESSKSEKPRVRLESLALDWANTSVEWQEGKGKKLKISKGHIDSSIENALRFMWVFVAYKYRSNMPSYGIPSEYFRNIGNNLHQLNQPNPKLRGCPVLRQLFGESTRYSNHKEHEIPCCRIVHLFDGKFASLAYEPSISANRLEPACINIRLRPEAAKQSRAPIKEELRAILDEFDPDTSKSIWEKQQQLRPGKSQHPNDVLPATLKVIDPKTADFEPRRFEGLLSGDVNDNTPDDVAHKSPDVHGIRIPSRRSAQSERGKTRSPRYRIRAKECERPPASAEIAVSSVYEQTALEIDKLLLANPQVGNFLRTAASNAVQLNGKILQVAAQFHHAQGDVCDVLKGIKAEIHRFPARTSDDWGDLLTVVGGYFTFAVDPKWVIEQRSKVAEHGLRFPGGPQSRKAIAIQKIRANILPALTAAFAGGLAKLHRIFRKLDDVEDTHDLSVALPPQKSTLQSERIRQIEKFLIEYMLRETNFDVDNEEQMRGLRENLHQELQDACIRLRDPYIATHQTFEEITLSIRQKLELEHLYVMLSSGSGMIEETFSNVYRERRITLVKLAAELFDEISTKQKIK